MVVETGLTDRSSIFAQLSELGARLDAADKAFRQFSTADEVLYARMHDRFTDEFREAGEDLSALEDKLWAGQSLGACWEDLAKVKTSAEVLLGDCLAFIHGALTRTEELDWGLCRIADYFLQKLSAAARVEWRSLTVLAESEFYENLAQIVRLRFAEVSIWSLPVAAHEFGHFAGPAIRAEAREKRRWRYDHPLQQLLDEELLLGENNWARMHEHIADIFATYSLGPSYVYTCVLLRFDPSNPNLAYRHPSDTSRVFTMLETLRRMNEADETERPYSVIIGEIDTVWQSSVASAGATLEIDRTTALGNARFEEIYDLLAEVIPTARYSSMARADRLQAELDPQARDGPRIGADDTIPDVLNAAWLHRVGHWDASAEAIGKRALAACNRIVDGANR